MAPITLEPGARVVGLAPSAPCGRVGVPNLAKGVERTWTSRVGRRCRQRGTRGGGRSRDATRVGNVARRSNSPGAWFDSAETTASPEDRDRRGHLVPAVQRTREWIGPRWVDDHRRTRRCGLRRQRTEGVEHQCPPCRPGNVARSDELGRAQAQGHLVDGPAHAPAGRRCTTIAPDEWSCVL